MNPDGLFERVDVFTKLNIPKEDHYINDGGFKFSTFFRSTYKKTLVQIHSSEPNKTC